MIPRRLQSEILESDRITVHAMPQTGNKQTLMTSHSWGKFHVKVTDFGDRKLFYPVGSIRVHTTFKFKAAMELVNLLT